jgi:hypothetical protein
VSIKRSHRRVLILAGTMTVLPRATGFGVAVAGHRNASTATTEPGESAVSVPTGPDLIYMAAPVPDAAQFVRQLRAAGLDTPVYGGDVLGRWLPRRGHAAARVDR